MPSSGIFVNGVPVEVFSLADILEKVAGLHPQTAYVRWDPDGYNWKGIGVMSREGSETVFNFTPGRAHRFNVNVSVSEGPLACAFESWRRDVLLTRGELTR